MARQLAFPLPARPALGREDFYVAPSNVSAVAMLDAWQAWPQSKLVLTAPAGGGKTHLAHVWAQASGARIVSAAELPDADIPGLLRGPLAVEAADTIAGHLPAEHAAFHLHNLAQAQATPLLLTARTPPSRWGLTLPDLASRLEATTTVQIDAPDDALLHRLLEKNFADHQLQVRPETIKYIARRMERSAGAARDIVAALDRLSLAEKRPVTRVLAARFLEH